MSANRKVFLIVFLGIATGILGFVLSQFFSGRVYTNHLLLAHIQQFPEKVESIKLLSKGFIQNPDVSVWQRITAALDQMRFKAELPAWTKRSFQNDLEVLQKDLSEYGETLNRIQGPAVRLNSEKMRLQAIGLSFSSIIEILVTRPYQKDRILRTSTGESADPLRLRIMESANEVIKRQLQQQVLLLELLLDWDLAGYLRNKIEIADTLKSHMNQLHELENSVGAVQGTNDTVASLERMIAGLTQLEQVIVTHFSSIDHLNEEFNTAGDRLLQDSEKLTSRIVSDISFANRLNRILSLGLLIAITGGMGLLGTLLANDVIRFVTDLERSREESRDSENNLKVTLDSIGDAVIATDAESRITRMNPAAEKLTGWLQEEGKGRPLPEVFRIISAKTRKAAANPVEKVLAKGEVVGLANHTALISRNGKEYQIADSGAPIRDNNGTVLGVVLVFRDVTRRYLQAEKIRENERLLDEITRNIPGVVYQFISSQDHEYTNTFISEKAVQVFGIKAEPEVYFKEFFKCIPDEDKDRFLRSIHYAVENVTPWHYEGRFVKPDGRLIWFSGKSNPHMTGDAVLFNGVLLDITREKRLEESLRMTRFMFEKASIGIYRANADARILDVNNQTAVSLGYSVGELCSMSVFDIDPSINKDTWDLSWNRLCESGVDSFETTYLRKDRVAFPAEITSNLIEYDGSRYSITFVKDITEQKQAEKEARRLEEALNHAQKMEAIGTLAGGIAHDFNNILSAVIGFSELSLSATNPASLEHEYLQHVLKAGMRARDLVNQILTFCRKNEPELIPVRILPLVTESLKLLRSSLPSTIEMSVQINGNIDNVLADPTQIHQVVMNLCTNAAHAMAESGGLLTVSLEQITILERDERIHPELVPGDYVKFCVEDTGAGIPHEILHKVFDPYFTTKEKGKGTGLGLSVVHGIVNRFGGVISVNSEPNRGTIFNVYLPTIGEEAFSDGQAPTELPGGNEHILLVDDETALLEMGRRMLEMLGYQVTTAEGGMQALEIFRQKGPQNFDLVITDMTMPKLTGDRLAVELLGIRRDLPIILCTGYSEHITEAAAAKIGIRAFIGKPIAMANLAVELRNILDG